MYNINSEYNVKKCRSGLLQAHFALQANFGVLFSAGLQHFRHFKLNPTRVSIENMQILLLHTMCAVRF